MSFTKRYLKNRPLCKVTFRLPKEAAGTAGAVSVAGEFNNWNIGVTPMKKLKNGTFTATLNLETDREYQFRYVIDETLWENDWNADKYVPTVFGDSDNSVVVV